MPLFTVIIPTYNRAHILPRAVASVLEQSFFDFELIIVDDGSNDGTDEWVRSLKDERVVYLAQPNAGVCAARNSGAKMATGEFLVFLDSDDWVKPEWLSDFKGAIAHSSPDLVICGRSSHSSGPVEQFSFLAGTFAIRRHIFVDIGGYDEALRFGENTELKWRLDALGIKTVMIGKENIFYDNSERGGSGNHQNRIQFVKHVLAKHSSLLNQRKRWMQMLYQIAGVSSFQLGMRKDAALLIWKGYFSNPAHMKSLGRALLYSFKLLS